MYRELVLVVVVSLVGCGQARSETGSGRLSVDDQREALTNLRKALDLERTPEWLGRDSTSQERVASIHFILSHTAEGEIHRMRGAHGNQVFLHKDGHREAVYDESGSLVRDGINDGSFNYFHPRKDPLRHFSFDIVPWILWGSSRGDPTSIPERINAYSADLYQGLRRALAAERDQKGMLSATESARLGSADAIAIFSRAMKLGGGEDLVDLLATDEELTPERIVSAVRGMERGLQRVFSGKD